MLPSAKKLLTAVADSFGGGGEETSAWTWGDKVTAWMGGTVYKLWQAWKRGLLPTAGGWLDQPLALLVQIEAIELVHQTYRYMAQEKADMSKLSATQMSILRNLENG
jgi:hypothetical protein